MTDPTSIPNPFELIDSRLSSVEALLLDLAKELRGKNEEERLISPKEACEMFIPKISLPTLKRWDIPRHSIGNRIYYKKSEILDSVKTIKRFHPK